MKFFNYFLLTFILITNAYPSETCSRVAIINYQEVLVDTSSDAKGEGLRFYLEKDPSAAKLLDEYQEINKPSMWSAASSTVGSLMILTGLLQNSTSELSNRNTFIYGGLIISLISYLASKTTQFNSEKVLQRAVEQYNKRNQPRIYFSPYQDSNQNFSIGVGIQQEF